MKFRDFLLEGGQAVKGVSKITQQEVREILPDLITKISLELKLSKSKVKVIGSAGKKPNPDDLSGDIDIAVECKADHVSEKLSAIAGENPSKAMVGINVYSFGYPVGNKLVQVDLMPVDNVRFAEWSYQANEEDLKEGLKGAQRNELFFAVAKNMPQEILSSDADGPIEVKRFFYDLSKGLMEGIKSRKGKKKLSKNFSTTDKKLLTNDPEKITQMMFGKDFSPDQVSTFEGTLSVIRDKGFQYHEKVHDILELAREGIRKKGLKIPSSL